MPKMDAAALIEMCASIDALGGDHNHPEIVSRFLPIEPDFATHVDQTLDPFSDAYFDRQIALYREIAGRELDQESGELHAGDFSGLIGAANPLGQRDVRNMAEAVRQVATMLSLACLSDGARVLDMGAGPGISSEIQAFAGCRVHAVDIDAPLGTLARDRAAARGLDIIRSVLNYDDLSSIENQTYEAAFFLASLHHCLRPWDLIAQLHEKLLPNGVIAFAAEPIQTIWWRHWGLRLDIESLYVARARGWFESGWSHDFLRRCFERAGFQLIFFSGGINGGDIGVASVDPARLEQARAKATGMGLIQTRMPDRYAFPPSAFASICGTRADVPGGAGLRQSGPEDGALIFGPYVTLSPGVYETICIVSRDERSRRKGGAVFDVTAAAGTVHLAAARYRRWHGHGPRLLTVRFALDVETAGVELRVLVSGNHGWSATLPALRRIDGGASPQP